MLQLLRKTSMLQLVLPLFSRLLAACEVRFPSKQLLAVSTVSHRLSSLAGRTRLSTGFSLSKLTVTGHLFQRLLLLVLGAYFRWAIFHGYRSRRRLG